MSKEDASISRRQQTVLSRHLRRIDADFLDIILVAGKACVYRFQDEWIEMGIEGTLYLYSRGTSPAHRLVVLNRRSLNDFKMDVLEDFKCEPEGKFVILSSKRTAFGFWLEDEESASMLFRTLCGLQER